MRILLMGLMLFFSFALQASEDEEGVKETVRMVAIGDMRTKNGVTLSAYRLEMPDGGYEDMAKPIPPDEALPNVPEEFAERLEACFHVYGWLLIPKGWQLSQAMLGANSSEMLRFTAPDGEGFLLYDNTGDCVGCAVTAAAQYFPELREEAQLYGANADDFTQNIQLVRLKPTVVAWRSEENKKQVDGVAYYQDTDERTDYFQASISLVEKERDLARPILNYFLSLQAKN